MIKRYLRIQSLRVQGLRAGVREGRDLAVHFMSPSWALEGKVDLRSAVEEASDFAGFLECLEEDGAVLLEPVDKEGCLIYTVPGHFMADCKCGPDRTEECECFMKCSICEDEPPKA